MNSTASSATVTSARSIATFEWLIMWLCIFLPPLALLAADHSPTMLIRFYPDDAFYYLQIAWNAANYGSVSFDGTNLTTGFHPLQMLLCTIIFLFSDKNSALIVLFIFNAFAIAITLTLLIRKLNSKPIAIAIALLLASPLFTLYIWTSSGLEGQLLLICSSLFAIAWLRTADHHRSTGRAFTLGICAGLVLLARLDTILPLSIFGGVFLLRAIRSKAYSALAAAIGGALLLTAPYLLWMLSVQGSVFPVSGIAKSARPRWPLADIWRALTGDTITGSILLLLPVLICLFTIGISTKRGGATAHFIFLTACSGLLYSGYLLFIAHEPFRWYLAYPIYTAMACIIWLSSLSAEKLSTGLTSRHILLLGVLIASISYTGLVVFSRVKTTSYGLYLATQELRRLLPASSPATTRIATHDAGVIGFFSGLKVFNLDGLVNSLENWRNYLAQREYAAYLEKEDVQFLLVKEPLVNEDFILAIPTTAFDSKNYSQRIEAAPFSAEILYKIDLATLKRRHSQSPP